MKRSIPRWQLAGFLFTAILGTFLHFLFDLTGQAAVAGLFSAVNESIWEHMKLLFYPMLLFALVEYAVWGKEDSRFWCAKLLGIATGLVLIPVLYYTYTGALGVSADWFNITIFFLTAGIVFWLETKYLQSNRTCRIGLGTAIAILCLTAAAFTMLTFIPPHIPLFRDPVTGTYGFWQA